MTFQAIKSTLASATVLVATLLVAMPASALQVVPVETKFEFTGTCSDCDLLSEPVIATLVLEGYLAGTPIQASHFVSLSYVGSDKAAAFTVTRSGAGGSDLFDPESNIGGSLGASSGAADFHLIFGDGWGLVTKAAADQNGDNWYVCSRNPNGFGGNFGYCDLAGLLHADVGQGQWSAAAVPEPASYVMMGLGLLGLAATARRRAAA